MVREALADATASPSAPGLLAMIDAVALQAKGDHAGAIAVLSPIAQAPARAPVGPPLLPRVHELLGASLLVEGRSAEAVAAYEQALSLTPNRASALIGLARACAAAGDRVKAAAAYRRLLDSWHRADAGLGELAEARTGAAG
jgi:Flp pilus assembly protein TadD